MLEHINKYFNTIYNSFYSISLDEFTSIINTKIDEFENLVNEVGESNISTKTIINTTRNTLSQTIIEYKSNNNQQ